MPPKPTVTVIIKIVYIITNKTSALGGNRCINNTNSCFWYIHKFGQLLVVTARPLASPHSHIACDMKNTLQPVD